MMEPTKILIYVCKAKPYLSKRCKDLDGDGSPYLLGITEYDRNTTLNGLVCFECECKEAFKYDFVHRSGDSSNFYIRDQRTEKMKDCLSNDDLFDYGKGKTLYAYHFENVKPIYPMPITCLYKDEACTKPLTRAPQSHCFAYRKIYVHLFIDGNRELSVNELAHVSQDNVGLFNKEKVLVFSIRSPWCCKYGNGEKDLEIRKTRIMHAGIEYK